MRWHTSIRRGTLHVLCDCDHMYGVALCNTAVVGIGQETHRWTFQLQPLVISSPAVRANNRRCQVQRSEFQFLIDQSLPAQKCGSFPSIWIVTGIREVAGKNLLIIPTLPCQLYFIDAQVVGPTSSRTPRLREILTHSPYKRKKLFRTQFC